MNLEFTKIIRAIENEISAEYLPGAIKWADEKYDGAWSKAIDEFEAALNLAIEKNMFTPLVLEAEEYKAKLLPLIKEYKKISSKDETSELLKSIREGIHNEEIS